MTLDEYADHGDVESSKSLVLTDSDYVDCADFLGIEIGVIKAVAEVESRGRGFFPDDTPKTLFEGHVFHRLTSGIYAADNPDLSYPRWTKIYYGKTWQAEKIRFNRAKVLDSDAAMMSTSWGKFQIMGFNFKACGYNSVLEFVKAMFRSEGEQLAAFSRFIKNNPHMQNALQERDWLSFASAYNGTGQITYYAGLLQTAFERNTK